MLVYDLLDSPDCLPDLLQGSLKNKGRDEAFLLSSFRLQTKAPTSLYSVINPKENTKYLELIVQAKLNKGDFILFTQLLEYITLPAIWLSIVFFCCLSRSLCSLLFLFPWSLLSPPVVLLRYQKTDGRFGTISFNHASLADGQDHHVMLHASGLQRGPPRLNIYVDCRLVHTLNDLPAAFGSLPTGPKRVALRTLQSSGQVNKTAYSWQS